MFLCHGQECNEEGETQMFTRHHHRLRLSFKEFVKRLVNCCTEEGHCIEVFDLNSKLLTITGKFFSPHAQLPSDVVAQSVEQW